MSEKIGIEAMSAKLVARFCSRFDSPESGCWEWNSYRHNQGYGHFYSDGKIHKAHRFMWEMTCGKIPKGMKVLHTCDNPPCVRPSHLFLGTSRHNSLDMVRKGRSSGKLTTEQIREIRKIGSSETQKVLAARYGVTQTLISAILRGKIWRDSMYQS